ncbi:MAG: FAD:protein FMN transferase [Candidatus Omnitrophica bacterium]|nr:FAD:protein FMN transferase [Candidatus Omnitrophota bacterium]
MMGTFVEVVSPDESASGIVFDEISRIEGLLSKYKAESEVSRLNNEGRLRVSPETLYILAKSKEFWYLSEGAFDVTVGPLADIWGFNEKKFRVTTESEIKSTLKYVGMDKIDLNNSDNVVKFKIPGIKIDLGAIAKGYALDCSINKLKEKGVKDCLINAGGQIYCLGKKGDTPWKVAVRRPRSNALSDKLRLENKSIATSGDYEQFFIKEGKRYSHILNPKTGYPADSGILSVTVISTEATTADALATAVFVLGKEKGLRLAKKFPGTKVEIIGR